MIDPWTIADRYISNLNAMTEKNRYYSQAAGQNAQEILARQQAADLTYQRGLEKDATNFQQQVTRDEANRMFQHNENYLRSTYDSGGLDKSRFGGGATAAPTGPTPYVSPYADPTQTAGVPAPQQPQVPSAAPTPDQAYAYYIQKGVPPMVAAGIIGNMDAESGFRPDVWSGAFKGDKGTAGYAGQWRGYRLANLEAFARSRGHGAPTTEDQLDFYLHEGQAGLDPGAKLAMELASKASSPEEAAAIIMTHYERPSGDAAAQSIKRRQSTARDVFNRGGSQVAGGQRRYYPDANPNPMVQPNTGAPPISQPASTAPSQEVQQVQESTDQPIAVGPGEDGEWSIEELKAQGIDPNELTGIRPDQKIVGHTMLTEKQVEMAQNRYTDLYDSLFPLGKKTQYGPTEYLILAPRVTSGDPLQPGQQAAPGVTQAPTVEVDTPENPGLVRSFDGQPIELE